MRVLAAGIVSLALGFPGLLTLPQSGPKPKADGRTLYFFFTPESGGAAEGARKAVEYVKARRDQVRLRPVLLVSKFEGVGKLDDKSPLYLALKELQALGTLDIPMYDEDGLRLAEAWEVRSVPTFVLVAAGRAHRAVGPRANLNELTDCKQ